MQHSCVLVLVHSILKNLICKLNAWKMRAELNANAVTSELTGLAGWTNQNWMEHNLQTHFDYAFHGISNHNRNNTFKLLYEIMTGGKQTSVEGIETIWWRTWIQEFEGGIKSFWNINEQHKQLNSKPPNFSPIIKIFFWKYCSENKLDSGRLPINLVISSNLIYCILFYSLNRNNSLLYISL